MGILKLNLEEKHKKLKVIPKGSVTDAMSVETGFPMIDYMTATIVETLNGEMLLNLGIPFGKIIEFIGNSQSGKSTLAYQIGVNMTKEHNGDLIIADFERSGDNLKARLKQISGLTTEQVDNLVSVYKHEGMSTEFFKQLVFDIIELKKKLSVKDMLDWKNINGEDIKIYPPTVIVLDSVPSMKPDEVLTDATLDNNMIPSKMAAANSALLKTIVNVLETYNITIIAINHITTKIVTNKYAPRQVQLPGLSETENLPGGNCWSYIPTYIFKLTSGAELKADKAYTDGRYTDVRIIKSRSGFNNTRMKFVLDSKIGFSNPYTMLEFIKEHKLLEGGGRSGFSLPDSDVKFTLKKFNSVYHNNDEFREHFHEVLESFLLDGVNERYESIMEADIDDDIEDDLDAEFDDE